MMDTITENIDHELRKIDVSLVDLNYIGYIMVGCSTGVEYTLYKGENIVGWATFNGITQDGNAYTINTTLRLNQTVDYIVVKGFLI